MVSAENIVMVTDQAIKYLDLGAVPKARDLLVDLQEKLEREKQKASKDYKIQELNSQMFSGELQEIVLKLNETIRFSNNNVVRKA